MKTKNSPDKSFGIYIREIRILNNIGQRELAQKIGIAASYLNDIEKNKRSAPKIDIIKKISIILKIESDLLNDLAGKSKNTLAPDIIEYIEKNPSILSLIRTAKNNNLENEEINQLELSISNSKTKTLIVAAGLGSRLKSHTENTPKCMLDFGGKTLLERQLSSYKKCGIEDISLVRGYKKSKINYKGIKYYDNDDYKNNNILNSIFYAEEEINNNIIISYSDILFEPFIVQRTIDSDHDISVVVDIDWKDYYINRKEHPLSEAENVIFNSNKPFQRAKTFQKAYLTDMVQELVDSGIKVHCIVIKRGWKEIDTVEDYKKALTDFTK